ncbi:nucleotidyltransferase family protein [Pseudocolwellia sp. AS88]|uniref:nucleotidyltransferase domain-containing protein n=1 Tax=Pseudocolwellia sp. AS88 TaxID=3063958 RepID=UPI0026ECDAAF|nr:nucleotidyltransferase family protein [Pseudocolwellia sp. AS88]MDO7086724.1 nucleotidyltransferase family protein [Pseudocolwellia sp. AS88]
MFDYKYTKNKGSGYFELLRLASGSDICTYSISDKKRIISLYTDLFVYQELHQRLVPLLRSKAKNINIFEDLDPSIQMFLTIQTNKGIVTELSKKIQLNQMIDEFSKAGVSMILLKGAAFSSLLYSAQAPRTSNDIDILVKEEHWEKAVSILSSFMKYKEKECPGTFGDLYEISFLSNNIKGVTVDLHKSLIHPHLFNFNNDFLWADSEEAVLYKNPLIRVLSPEYSLIHQALHAYKDMDFAKYNLVDSHRLISKFTIDDIKLINIANDLGAKVPLYIMLYNCKFIMGTQINDDLLQVLKPSVVKLILCKYVLRSRYNQPINSIKSIRYRLIQLLSVFLYTSSSSRSLSLLILFIRTYIKARK